jgi:hypothetical protein
MRISIRDNTNNVCRDEIFIDGWILHHKLTSYDQLRERETYIPIIPHIILYAACGALTWILLLVVTGNV